MSDGGSVLDGNSLAKNQVEENLPRGDDGGIDDGNARAGGYSVLRGDGE